MYVKWNDVFKFIGSKVFFLFVSFLLEESKPLEASFLIYESLEEIKRREDRSSFWFVLSTICS